MNNALIQLMKDGWQSNGVQRRGPLTNEIKIFKHCFTILQALSLFSWYLFAIWSRSGLCLT